MANVKYSAEYSRSSEVRHFIFSIALILLSPLPLLANEGKLLIECNVQASVKLNGITIGETGVTIDKLPEGEAKVTVSATGYLDHEEKVTLVAFRLVKLNVKLKTDPNAEKPAPEDKTGKKEDKDKTSDKDKKPEELDREKELRAVKQRYNKWQRTRKALICKPCKGRAEIYCKYCKGSGKERVLGRGGMMTVRCRTCMGKAKWPCQKCKETGRNLSKIEILFWEILDPKYKFQMDISADKEAAMDMGVATSKGKKGFTTTFDISKLAKKFNVVKELEYRLDEKCEYAAVTWKCIIKKESWSEGIVFRRGEKEWFWVPDKSPSDVKAAPKKDDKKTKDK